MTEKELKEKEYSSFGYANDWKKTPQKVEECANQGHLLESMKDGFRRTVTTVWCNKCKLTYKYDSSD